MGAALRGNAPRQRGPGGHRRHALPGRAGLTVLSVRVPALAGELGSCQPPGQRSNLLPGVHLLFTSASQGPRAGWGESGPGALPLGPLNTIHIGPLTLCAHSANADDRTGLIDTLAFAADSFP